MEQVTQKIWGVIVAAALWSSLIIFGDAAAETKYYTLYSDNAYITMDVVKEDGFGSSGTWVCKSLKDCYTKVLSAEERGASLYCKTITIKRNGVAIWHRDYNDPYWITIKKQSSHADWYK